MSADFAPTTRFPVFGDGPTPSPTRFLRWFQRRSDPLQDRRTGLLNREGLVARADAVLRSRSWARASLVVLSFDDLPESAVLWGDAAANALMLRIAHALRRAAGRRGLAARTGPVQFAVLLPGRCRQSAIDAVTAVLGQPCRVELDWHGEELVCVPDVAAEVWEGEEGGIAPLLEQLCASLARHRNRRARHHDFIRRERERHSRPFGCSQVDSLPAS
ncbi:GGDEF domain-containing protein [Ramlibacter algicola]|uniref:GGDEF domain-containing protein n=1 Tax=Ramlibacter algicola TaxID=2795217 RepID=A0A934Q1T6_9BURK|nr:GGDEF domain-containing protein [Ramlibacter algicola]MBK0393213.1 GGDEF domain-containing protein [Ramlibacter algicola]